MTVADWALVISILSALVSFAGFIWNVWSKFIYPKPRVRVSFSYSYVTHPLGSREDDYDPLCLSATNFGPGDVRLHSALVRRKRRWLRRSGFGLLNPLISASHRDSSGPFSGGLPKTVVVGENFSVYLVPNHTGLAANDYDRIGFDDTFGRHHWAPTAQIIKARKSIRDAISRMGPARS